MIAGRTFRLGPELTAEQRAHFEEHGYLHFEGVLAPAEVAVMREEIARVESRWLAEKRATVNGIPLFLGVGPEGRPAIQRLAFVSLASAPISEIVRDRRFAPIRALAGDGARVGEREKDGVVVNQFVNERGSVAKRLGWHTDGLRDLFYLRMPRPMLNVGLHLDDCPAENGGLRLLPGTHRQGFLAACFAKPYFLWHRPDPREVCVETRPGDLTVHDGRLWHRVARSRRIGAASLRRSVYVPYLTGPYEPKSESSPTPGYHRLAALSRRLAPRARTIARSAFGLPRRLLRARSARSSIAAALVAALALLGARRANAAGFWNFDKGVSNFGRGGANIAAPDDPIGIYTNPAAIAGLDGFRLVVDGDMARDDRKFARAPDADGTAHPAVENRSPDWPPSPSFFATWRARPGLTLGAALFGPPRSDIRWPDGGPQRYQLIESHNLQIESALAVGWELPWRRLRLGATALSINQVVRSRLAFNSFLGAPEDPAWDATLSVRARDERIPCAILGSSIGPLPWLTLASSVQLPYDVRARGRVEADTGSALAGRADVRPGDVTVRTRMPGILRGAARADGRRWNAEAAFVFESWRRNDQIRFVPDQPGGLALIDHQSGMTFEVQGIAMPTHLRDTWSLRLGGERELLPGRLTLRSGVFFERAAISPRWISASSLDLDKLGVTAGTHLALSPASWVDLAAGYEHWFPVCARDSRVRMLDPITGERLWPVANGRYSNVRTVAMASVGVAFGGR